MARPSGFTGLISPVPDPSNPMDGSRNRLEGWRAGRVRLAAAVWVPALFLFLLALAPRLILIWRNPFDGLYGQDAYAYFTCARQIVYALTHGQLPPYFWWPLGYPLLLDFSFLIFGQSIHSAQLITILSGAALAPLVFLLTREASGGSNVAGWVAGALLALSGQAVQSSVVIMADAPGLMWAILSAWLLLRYHRARAAPSLYGSALAIGLSLVTRWENMGFALAWFVALLFLIMPTRRQVWRPVVAALTLAGSLVLAQLAYNVAFAAPLAGQSWLEGWNPIHFVARSFDNVDGHFDYALPVGLFYAQVIAHPAYLFPIMTPLFLIGSWLLIRRSRTAPVSVILLLGWIVITYFFLAGIPYENFRFGLAFFGPVAAVSGIGAGWAWNRLQQLNLGLAPRAAFVALVVLALGGSVFWEPRVLQPFLSIKQTELNQIDWLSARLPSRARLYTFGVTLSLQQYTPLNVSDLSDETPGRVVGDVTATTPSYLFLDVGYVETQWRGHPLQQTFDTLRSQVDLQQIDTMGTWTLYSIGAVP